ncbi:MAG: response regulator transcription factor [Candidatus Kaiserbacteria bacterium]|nr:response regulator transcription factor [Candidatus Kaiserbacteria bacterium]MCB9816867.1 response regulator transcription factor [Candidatus Nomurabacteria bacterium]
MRILIVEDEKKIRDFLKHNLEAACYAVDTCVDGAEGLRTATLNEYDLIILDNVMPNMTGLEVCTELRRSNLRTPILLLSVLSDTDIKVQALNAGADDYLTKPFSLTELLARIRALLRRPPQIEAEVFCYKDLTVDTRKHTVTKDGAEVALTRKEFTLLTYLMRHQGSVLSRGMIMEHVWDMNADPFSNTIETHIASLRRKLCDAETNEYIMTISGCGYKFGAFEGSAQY